MANVNEIATQFVNFYYATFDRNRAELLPLYRDMSMLSFEGKKKEREQVAAISIANSTLSSPTIQPIRPILQGSSINCGKVNCKIVLCHL